jgi:hypothetical protein
VKIHLIAVSQIYFNWAQFKFLEWGEAFSSDSYRPSFSVTPGGPVFAYLAQRLPVLRRVVLVLWTSIPSPLPINSETCWANLSSPPLTLNDKGSFRPTHTSFHPTSWLLLQYRPLPLVLWSDSWASNSLKGFCPGLKDSPQGLPTSPYTFFSWSPEPWRRRKWLQHPLSI